MRAKEMASLPKATRRNYASVCNYLFSDDPPVSQHERDLFMHDVDFVALVEQDESKAVDGFIEDLLSMIPSRRLTQVSLLTQKKRKEKEKGMKKEMYRHDLPVSPTHTHYTQRHTLT